MKTLLDSLRWIPVILAVMFTTSSLFAAEVERYDTFRDLPITSIKPQGWLRLFLENQRDGLTGHLDKASGFPFDSDGWWSSPFPEKGAWTGHAEWGMYLDGVHRCGYLLDDDFLINKARQYIEYTLNHQAVNGILGPNWTDWTHGSEMDGGRYCQYHFFHTLMTEHSATGDPRILPAMQRHYMMVPPRQHAVHQNTGNMEEMCWLYEATGDERMLEQAEAAWRICNETKYSFRRNFDLPLVVLLSEKKATQHGLTYFDGIRGPLLLYKYTGDQQLLEAVLNGFRKVDRDHMLIDGCPSSNECFAGKNPRALHETCVVPAYSWVASYLMMITGDASWGDKIERCIFNAGIGSVTKDYKGVQYYSGPNQVIVTSKSSHNHQAGPERMQYRPGHQTQCCPGSVHSFMPNYVSRMWLKDPNGGLVAATYGPSTVTANVGSDNQEVTIVQRTDYPFSEQIEFEVQCDQTAQFPLWLRIPGWCQEASLTVNDESIVMDNQPGTFFKLDREFAAGDKVVLNVPMKPKLSFWQEGGLGIERGPLVYSLLIDEDRTVDEESVLRGKIKPHQDFPLWNILPASPWNYALHVSYEQEELEKEIEVIQNPMVPNPWEVGAAPVQLRVPARQISDWELEEGVRTPRLPSPVLPSGDVKMITLVPQGSTCIRLTVFPECKYKWGRVACDRICAEDGS